MSSLTTTFTPPASCTHTGIAHIQVNDVQYYLLQGEPATSTDCYPDGYDPDRTALYAPGVCPSGYTEACSRLETFATVTETIFTCCPTQLVHSCLTSTNERYSWQNTLACHSAITTERDGKWTISAVTRVSDGTTQIARETGTETFGAVNAHGVQIKVWDGAFPTSTSTSTSTSATQDAGTTTTTQDPGPTAAQSEGSGPSERPGGGGGDDSGAGTGLSPGAAAGIGIGAGVLVISACLFAIWLLRRRRKRTTNGYAAASKGNNNSNNNHNNNWPPRSSTDVQELSAEPKVPFVRHEMVGDHQYPYRPGDPPRELESRM
ncbi:hypothetical protein CTA2_3016 [Colletotrichum tanaceti]|uniref:Uncharacterized protein n=1 Tax=Colletotrichum tanaceti TaxID=1306861 RepID=A0A4U6X627_9PEZI|nr:hypothetical protein CTA2_3016 [Colletotrichum tanaceti]TKW50453.1 hypothetical protein CTA1_5738 [Colletotrichum tanaceti]